MYYMICFIVIVAILLISTIVALRCMAKDHSNVKIVITSHIKYTVPLTTLFESINQHCPDLYHQTVLVVNGCNSESINKQMYLNSQKKLVVIRTSLNIWEYTAFPMITKYYNHSGVSSEYYMLLHDTCTVGQKFASNLQHNANQLRTSSSHNPFVDKNKIGLLRPSGVCSNLVIIHKEVVFKFENEVYSIKTKADAVYVENNQGKLNSFYDYDVHVVDLISRKFDKQVDIYNTGHPRHAYYYECFDLHKFIARGTHGDITGDIKPIF